MNSSAVGMQKSYPLMQIMNFDRLWSSYQARDSQEWTFDTMHTYMYVMNS